MSDTYYSPKFAAFPWFYLVLMSFSMLCQFVVLSYSNWKSSMLILPVIFTPVLIWSCSGLNSRLRKPALEIHSDRVTVQTKFGKFKRVMPLPEYEVIESTDFIAFRRGKENDITLEKNFIKKAELENAKAKLSKLGFLWK